MSSEPFDRIWNNYLPKSAKDSTEIRWGLLKLLCDNFESADVIAEFFVSAKEKTKAEMDDPIHLTSYNLDEGSMINFETHKDEAQRLHVIEGTMEVVVGKKTEIVDAGEVFWIPKNTTHGIFPYGGSARAWSDYPTEDFEEENN